MNVIVKLLNIITNTIREKGENAFNVRLISLWNKEKS